MEHNSYILNNGVQIPSIGYGTWKTPNGPIATSAVLSALLAGYRHIDTAAGYRNEQSVGAAIRMSGISRSDIFITSKLPNAFRGYKSTLESFEQTLANLQTDYLDLYLIHWPASHHRFENWEQINLDSWQAMTELYQAGKIKAIGVSNFMPHHMEALVHTKVPPMVDQIEFHPGLMWPETIEYCKRHNILVEAWSPLGTGRMLSNDTLIQIAEKYKKSVAQLCIRWALQNGVLPLPKSLHLLRIADNLSVFDFTISPEDMATISSIPYFGGSGLHPDQVDF